MRFGQAARLAGRMAGPAGLAVALGLLAACGKVGNPFEALGGRIPPPDEFQVIQYEPPVVPETYTLPEPRLGEISPRAPRPEQEAVEALLGPGAARAVAAEPSTGEQILLSSAGAASASSEIRVQLEEERRKTEASETYVPPTLWELFGFGSDEAAIDETQVIDPQAEAERLQAAGVATPVDPDAAARAAAAAEEEELRAKRPKRVFDRTPNNRLGPPPTPAY